MLQTSVYLNSIIFSGSNQSIRVNKKQEMMLGENNLSQEIGEIDDIQNLWESSRFVKLKCSQTHAGNASNYLRTALDAPQ